jgi:hypothetical protein
LALTPERPFRFSFISNGINKLPKIPNSKLQIPNKSQIPMSIAPSLHPSPLGGEGKGEGN